MRTGRPPLPIEERWRVKFKIVESGCWDWIGAKDRFGYGFIKSQKGVQLRAHRYSYSLYRGDIPDKLFVLHHCDNKSCVNPNHLFLGTNQDNMDDMVIKGKSPRLIGEKNGCSKLKNLQILEIRKDTRSQSKIAMDYGVTQTVISRVKRGLSWAHV